MTGSFAVGGKLGDRVMKLQKYFYLSVNAVIRVLLIVIISGICLQSMYSTSFIGYITREDGSKQEKTLNIADQPWKHLLALAVFIVICVLVYRGYCLWAKHRFVGKYSAVTAASTVKGSAENSQRAFRLLSIFIFLLGAVWILVTQLYPGSDPSKVYRIAIQWREGDFSSYAEGGYMFRYPFQSGITLFYYFLSFVFGVDNYVALQFVNLIALTVIYLLLAKLAVIYWKGERKLPAIAHAALILWLPFSFYVTYLYGILPGMALSLCAVYCTAMYLKTRKYRYILPAAICMGVATVIKMNCLIYLIAIICFLLYDAVDILISKKKEMRRQCMVSLVFILLLILSVVGCNQANNRYVERLSGYKDVAGESMISWVVMGLSDAPFGPGTYNGYIANVFVEYDYDTEKINAASNAEIKKILKRMSQDPVGDAIPFFGRKNAFQWNDPSFLCLENTKGRTSAVNMPEFVSGLIDGEASVMFYVIMNYVQTLIWFGVLFYLFLDWRNQNIHELFGAVIFLGGFLFHFIWESGASYTMPYFVIIIPYAVKGFADLVRCLNHALVSVKESKDKKVLMKDMLRKTYKPAAGILIVVILVALVSGRNIFRNTIALNDGEEAEAQFYHRAESETASKNRIRMYDTGKAWGEYCYLSPYTEPDKAVVALNEEMTSVSIESSVNDSDVTETKLADVRDIEHKVLILRDGSTARIRFRSNGQVLAVDESGEHPQVMIYMDDDMNLFYEPRNDVSYRWKMNRAAEGGYYITIGDMALTYRDDMLTVETLTKIDEQRWMLQK